MKKKTKKTKSQIKPTVPAWQCPKCGATHPITVFTCCAPKVAPIDDWPRNPYPWQNPWICQNIKTKGQ
jgi:hypothetical protein